MLEEMIKYVFEKHIAVQRPYLLHPPIMRATVTSVTYAGVYYEHNLKILDKNGEIDSAFPEIPNVRSAGGYQLGDTVVIAMPYGELDPVILSEAL